MHGLILQMNEEESRLKIDYGLHDGYLNFMDESCWTSGSLLGILMGFSARLEIISVRVSEKARSGKFRHHIQTKCFFPIPHRKKMLYFRCGTPIKNFAKK
jgi:hypothetical protein